MTLLPERTIAELKELRALTGTPSGAQRLAWSEPWARARAWLREKLAELPVTLETDEAGNDWATLRGRSEHALILGSHLDSVPDGGWLDGCYGVLGGLEVLRHIAAGGTPPVTVHLVDWADEEGVSFGRSMFGSGAVAGTLDPEAVRDRRSPTGGRLEDVVAAYGVNLNRAPEARRRLKNVAACLELHIEQGPVLESLGLPLGVVAGTMGIQRHAVRFTGQAVHAGYTSMALRRDALAAASRFVLAVREIGARAGGLCTVGRVTAVPGIITAVAGQCELTLDQRSFDEAVLEHMLVEAREASTHIAAEEKVAVDWSPLYHIAPNPFHPELVALCAKAVGATGCPVHRLPSGPLHDAAEISLAGVPTAMLFVQSLGGLSHINEEDTREDHLALGVQAFDDLASQVMAWIK